MELAPKHDISKKTWLISSITTKNDLYCFGLKAFFSSDEDHQDHEDAKFTEKMPD